MGKRVRKSKKGFLVIELFLLVLICVSLYGGYYFYNEIKSAEDGVKIISTLVREYALSMASDIVEVVSDCPDTDIAEINALMDTNTNMFGFKSIDYKTTMINLLEKELKKLKGK